MKKLLLVAVLAMFAFNVNAQDFGLMAGYTNVSVEDVDDGSGFHVGAFAQFELSEKFDLRPELVYTGSNVEAGGVDLSYNLFSINAMVKYNISDSFGLVAGPQFGFASGDIPDALDAGFGDEFSSLNLGLGIGAMYSFTESIFAQARYTFQLNDHVGTGADATVNQFTIGVGYQF